MRALDWVFKSPRGDGQGPIPGNPLRPSAKSGDFMGS